MDMSTAIIATGVVGTVGKWAQDQKLEIYQFVGFGFYAGIMAVVGSGSENAAKLASQFAALVLITAVLFYIVPIAKRLGYTK